MHVSILFSHSLNYEEERRQPLLHPPQRPKRNNEGRFPSPVSHTRRNQGARRFYSLYDARTKQLLLADSSEPRFKELYGLRRPRWKNLSAQIVLYLNLVSERLAIHGLTCALNKCSFARKEVQSLGHLVTGDSNQTQETHIRAIQEASIHGSKNEHSLMVTLDDEDHLSPSENSPGPSWEAVYLTTIATANFYL